MPTWFPQDDETALILACQNEHSDIAKLLIQKRARVDQKDKVHVAHWHSR